MQRYFIAVWSAKKVPTIGLEVYELQRTSKIHDQGLTAKQALEIHLHILCLYGKGLQE